MASRPLAPLVTSCMPTGHVLAEALKEHLEPGRMISFGPSQLKDFMATRGPSLQIPEAVLLERTPQQRSTAGHGLQLKRKCLGREKGGGGNF